MEIVGWLERPLKKIGLDNLGTQQPCVMIYTRLLPGVTNVTDRAAYFGFYPWFINAFHVRYPNATNIIFREKLRLADCLMTLLAERHAIALGEDIGRHSATCPGRLTLGPVAYEVSSGQVAELAKYADRSDDNKSRYFKNPLGGLGQYYLGPLRDEYAVLHGDTRHGVMYRPETGMCLIEAFGDGLDGDLFFETIEKGTVSAADLDRLAPFCPCNLCADGRKEAREALIKLFLLDRSESGRSRRTTFGLLLEYFYRREGAETQDAIKDFLGSCYAAALPSGTWAVNEQYISARSGWALYARSEMMSLAWSCFFKNALDALDGHPKPFASVNALAEWLLTTPAFAFRPNGNFDDLIQYDRANAPAIEDFAHPDHEVSMWRSLIASNPPSIELATRLLVRLVCRFANGPANDYAELSLSIGALSGYPLNLATLWTMARERWEGMDGEAWLRSLIAEVLTTHQRIAIRKIGQTGEDTLMFRCGDQGFFLHRGMDRIVETQPRLRQAFQILRDLGLTTWEPHRLPALTALGEKLIAELRS